MGVPQIIMVVLITIDLVCTALLHGQKRDSKYNFWAELIGKIGLFWILKAGGFW